MLLWHGFSAFSEAASPHRLLSMKLINHRKSEACGTARLLKLVLLIVRLLLEVCLHRINHKTAAERVYRVYMILVALSLLLRACIAFKRKMYLCFQAQKLIILCCIIEPKALEYLLNSWWLQAVKVGHCRIIHDIIIPVEQTIIIFNPDHSLGHDSLILVNGRV